MAFHTAMIFPTSHNQQIGVREASLCVLLVLEILCSSKKINFEHKFNFCVHVVSLVCFLCVWLCFICVSFEFTLGSCVFTLSLCCYRTHTEFEMVSNQHIVNTKMSSTHASTNLLQQWYFTYHAIHCRPRARNIFLFARKLECIARLIYFYISFGMLNSFLCL